MEKVVRITRKGEENEKVKYWKSRSYSERLTELEEIRQEVNKRLYRGQQGFQRVYRVIKKA
mgnify:CR=1 FL=1